MSNCVPVIEMGCVASQTGDSVVDGDGAVLGRS